MNLIQKFEILSLIITGPDIHFIAASVKNGKDFSWVCTHKVSFPVQNSATDLTVGRMTQTLRRAGNSLLH
jgi:hypothetical protein